MEEKTFRTTSAKSAENSPTGNSSSVAGESRPSQIDRAMGAIMGALIGDALGLGCHWYYDLEALRRDYGYWVSDYVTSKVDREDAWAAVAKFRHESGLEAGDVSQTGQVTTLLLESVADLGTYEEKDFTAKVDTLLGSLDGTAYSGRYTDWAMRDVWEQRHSGMDWQKVGSAADTSEAAIRITVLAARYFKDPERLAREGHGNILLTHRSLYVAGQSLSFALTLSALLNDTPLHELKAYMAGLAKKNSIRRVVPSFDVLTQAANGAVAAGAPVKAEPASLVCSMYGLSCTLGFMLPAAYYFIHRYPDDFEMAVLSAVNGGGNNMARAALTGALSGASVGLRGIPNRFITGLKDHERLLGLAENVAGNDCAE